MPADDIKAAIVRELQRQALTGEDLGGFVVDVDALAAVMESFMDKLMDVAKDNWEDTLIGVEGDYYD